jgi:hypothetical protein
LIKPKFNQQNLSILFSKEAQYKWPAGEDAKNVVVNDFFNSLELTNMANIVI